jgi:hypothetical protein
MIAGSSNRIVAKTAHDHEKMSAIQMHDYALSLRRPAVHLCRQARTGIRARGRGAALLLNATTARLSLDALALPPGATVAVVGGAGAVGGYAIQLAKADGLTVLVDVAASDDKLVRSLRQAGSFRLRGCR